MSKTLSASRDINRSNPFSVIIFLPEEEQNSNICYRPLLFCRITRFDVISETLVLVRRKDD
ncbi:hypothetical protein V6N11_071769 [Hibiscus sabdariffa]|uniref:Uncharacterized protein n=1 Tax=Hibiscus sabdariffa TaxID=183260 RepID=A0ABR2U1A0_9ROSI